MHKFYDPKMFHMMSEEEMKLEYAPKVVDGVVVGADEVGEMSVEEKLRKAVGEVGTTEEFMAAGFDVNFVGPDGVGPAQGGAGAMDREAGEGAGEDGDVDESGADGRECVVYVDEETFGVWCGSVDSREFRFGSRVQRWWVGLAVGEEGAVGALKSDDDETHVELFNRILADVRSEATGRRGGAGKA